MALRVNDSNLTKRGTRTPLSPLRCIKVAGYAKRSLTYWEMLACSIHTKWSASLLARNTQKQSILEQKVNPYEPSPPCLASYLD